MICFYRRYFPQCILILIGLCFLVISSANSNKDGEAPVIVFVILSQPNTYHVREATLLKLSILQQAEEMKMNTPIVHLLHHEWPEPGAWTVFPILSRLVDLHGNNSSWIFIGEDYTQIRLPRLIETIKHYSPIKDWFLGHSLFDRDATIIHHFAFFEDPGGFAYPDFAAGFLFSTSLLKKLADKWKLDPANLDFSIDAKHELALYIMQHLNVNLTHVPQLCVKLSDNCATHPKSSLPSCGSLVPIFEIYFAVKTCEKFHSDRVPVVKKTWGKDTSEFGFFSDSFDASIPSIVLNISNTERGHCAKTLGILNYIVNTKSISQEKAWVVVVDDDTLISISRLQQLLSCYNFVDSIVIGERYGFSVTSNQGYNYITGGGGIVLSMSVVKQLVESGLCICPSNDTPDDMFIGICLKRLGIPVIHSPLFHQARPVDYAEGYLSHQIPISFHKHWMIDPIQTYKEWLEETVSPAHIHTEL